MEYYVKSVIPIIESNYNHFTPVEKSIADFFIHNRKKQDFSAKAISELLYVSEASLSRFAKKCGYSGYREFLYQYNESFLEKRGTMVDHTRVVLNTYQELLNRTYGLVDEKQITRISQYLNQAKRVVVCGKGSSGFAAREMEFRFMRIGVDIDSVNDSDLIRMQAVFQDVNSLVFAFSISGQKKEIIYLLKEAHKRGAKTVLFTANQKGRYDEFCDEVVIIPSLMHLNHGNSISPQFPFLIMLDIIYSQFMEGDKCEKESIHDSTLRALEEEKSSND